MGQNEEATTQTREVRIPDRAFRDIEGINFFISIKSLQPLNAAKVIDAIFHTIDRIGAVPFAFKECEYLATKTKMYRQVACLSYLIIYQITDTEIIILAIVHSARKPSRIKKLRTRN